jgi:Neuraminidase (sialidase)
VRITAPKKQVPDYPYLDAEYDGVTVAGDDPDLFVMSFTNGQNGLVKVAVSDDGGMTWTKSNAGQTSNKVYPGLGGNTAVAVTGDDIGVIYMDAPDARVMANFSDDGGETWGEPIEISEGSAKAPNGRNYSMSADGVNGRIGFSWIDDTSVKYQEFNMNAKSLGGGGSTTVTGFPDGFSPVHNAGRDPMVQLRGDDYVGIAYAGCRQANCASSTNSIIDLMYQESEDNGDSFGAQTRPAAGAVGTNQMNQWPSLMWVDDSTRWVAYANWQSGYANYRVLVRSGTGNEFPT